jgi:hypothetical protein
MDIRCYIFNVSLMQVMERKGMSNLGMERQGWETQDNAR